jgi:hypothetical protein
LPLFKPSTPLPFIGFPDGDEPGPPFGSGMFCERFDVAGVDPILFMTTPSGALTDLRDVAGVFHFHQTFGMLKMAYAVCS